MNSDKSHQHFHNQQIIARVGMCLTKVSFLLFYQRLLIPKGVRWTAVWWAIWLCFWYNVLYALSLIITIQTECVGKAEKVAKSLPCINEFAVLTSASTINASSDLIIFLIPLLSIWGLHTSAARRWKLSAVFIIGFLSVTVSLMSNHSLRARSRPHPRSLSLSLSLSNGKHTNDGTSAGPSCQVLRDWSTNSYTKMTLTKS